MSETLAERFSSMTRISLELLQEEGERIDSLPLSTQMEILGILGEIARRSTNDLFRSLAMEEQRIAIEAMGKAIEEFAEKVTNTAPPVAP